MRDKYIPQVASNTLLHFTIDWLYHLFIELILTGNIFNVKKVVMCFYPLLFLRIGDNHCPDI
jgi:hypothetical protein